MEQWALARIRTIKPDFFKHESLFDAEKAEGMPLRMAFAGLWCVADREGRFRWRPRALKLDVLPYDDVDFSDVLKALERHGFVRRYVVDGEHYGWIPSFYKHQYVNKHEAQSVLPPPNDGEMVHAPEADEPEPETHVHAPDANKNERGEGNGIREGKGKDSSAIADSSAGADLPTPNGVGAHDVPADMVSVWNHELGDLLPKPRKLDQTRKAKLALRLKDDFGNDIGKWRDYCQRIRGSPHLIGDNDRAWKADLDWCLEPRNVNRILEGRYDRKPVRVAQSFAERLAAEHKQRRFD